MYPIVYAAAFEGAGDALSLLPTVVATVTSTVTEVVSMVTSNPIMLIGIAGGLVLLGIRIFKRLTRTRG